MINEKLVCDLSPFTYHYSLLGNSAWVKVPLLRDLTPRQRAASDNLTPSALRQVISAPPSSRLRGTTAWQEVTGEKSALVPLRQRLSLLTYHYSRAGAARVTRAWVKSEDLDNPPSPFKFYG